MKIQKIRDKVQSLDVQAQSCGNDCVNYTNTKTVGEPPNVTEPPAIYVCGCFSKKTGSSASGWSFW